jgi:hypothetical protein
MAILVYESQLNSERRAAFVAKVRSIASYLGTDPNWLMQVMYAESGLRATAYNSDTHASGLLQWVPDTLAYYGLTYPQILAMPAIDQLDYVKKYFEPRKGRLKSYYDVYFWVFFPAAIGKPDDWVIHTSRLPAATIARVNPAIDHWPHDGVLTVGEFKKYIESTVNKANWALVFGEKKTSFLLG